MIYNKDTTSPKAKATDGTSEPAEILNWEVTFGGFYNEDTAEAVFEVRNKLTMPILASDSLIFHLEFYKGQTAPVSGLLRDGFECEMSKQSNSNFWDTTVRDIYVRDDPTGDAVSDFNNAKENNGQDWYVFETDSELSRWNGWRSSKSAEFYYADVESQNDSYLCRNGSGIVECTVIECIARRNYSTNDEFEEYDFNLDTDGNQIITFPAKYSYILMNQSNIETAADRNRLRSLIDAEHTVEAPPPSKKG